MVCSSIADCHGPAGVPCWPPDVTVCLFLPTESAPEPAYGPGAHRARSRVRSGALSGPGAHRVRSRARIRSGSPQSPLQSPLWGPLWSGSPQIPLRSLLWSGRPLKWWFSAPPWWPPALPAPPWHPCLALSPSPLPLHRPGLPSIPLIRLRSPSLLDILISGVVFVEHLESASYRVGVVSRSCWCALVGHQM